MTVLILAPERDITADSMVAELDKRAVPVVRMDTAWFPQHASIDAELHAGRWVGTLRAKARRVELEGLRAVWYRNPSTFAFPDGMSAVHRRWALTEAKLGLGGVLASLPVLWVNHPARNAEASYKPLQLVTATACGLTVPDTLVTNHADAVRRFIRDGRTVTKVLGAPSIVANGRRTVMYTGFVDPADSLDGLEVTAHQFQRWVPKAREARVIAVGERLFAAVIHAGSEASYVDWRSDYPALTYQPVTPPSEVADGIRRYLAQLGLVYGAFDFVIRPDDTWVFLECNPGGQYGWIEHKIDAPITAALADLLEQGDRWPPLLTSPGATSRRRWPPS